MFQFSGEQHHGVALENFNESRMSRAGPDVPGARRVRLQTTAATRVTRPTDEHQMASAV